MIFANLFIWSLVLSSVIIVFLCAKPWLLSVDCLRDCATTIINSSRACRLRYIIWTHRALASKLLLKRTVRSLLEHRRIDLLPFISEKSGLITVYSWWIVQLEDGLRGIELAHLNLSTLKRHNFWWHYSRLDLLFWENRCVEEDVNEWVWAFRFHPTLQLPVLRDWVLDEHPVHLVHFTAIIDHALPDFGSHTCLCVLTHGGWAIAIHLAGGHIYNSLGRLCVFSRLLPRTLSHWKWSAFSIGALALS